jgi:prepilin-type N-terminal cleavage/methylation domain-containing protein
MSKRGFTLIEVLVVIGILLLLMALVLPAVTRAKQGVKAANDISNLRQLGQAAAIYQDQTGQLPLGAAVLVEAKLVPSLICAAMNDSSARGIANLFAEHHAAVAPEYRAVVTPYKNSFLGLRELMTPKDKLDEQFEGGSAQGWLVDLSEAVPSEPYGLWWSGNYRRLLNDGAVQRKHTVTTAVKVDGQVQPAHLIITLFADFPESWSPGKF